ncbi:PIN domain-containing protein [Candidatus Margulisiibacteriota bacterium]
MQLILDTNIIISALLKDGVTRAMLLSPGLEYLLPEFALEEIQKHLPLLIEKSGLKESSIKLLLSLMLEQIKIVPSDKIIPFIPEADKIIGNIDKNDVPFIALALSRNNDGIWTNDTHFDKQTKIKIWKTQDLIHNIF